MSPSPKKKIVDDPIDLDRTVRGAWRTVMANKGPAILAPLLAALAVIVLLIVVCVPIVAIVFVAVRFPASPWIPRGPGGAPLNPQVAFTLYQMGLTACVIPLTAWIGLGMVSVFLKIVRRQRATPRDLFGQGHLVVPAIVAYSLSTAAQSMAVFAFFIGAIAVQVALIFVFYFILDRGLGPIAALQASWQVTWSFRTILKLIVVSLLLQVGAMLTCGIGAIVLTPWLLVIFARIYVLLSARDPCLHCGMRSAPRTPECRQCHEDPRALPPPPEGVKPLELTIPARERAGWVNWAALVLVIPLISQGGSPYGGAWVGLTMGPMMLNVHWALGVGMGLGMVCVPLVAALWLLIHTYTSRRKVVLDEAGAWFGGTDRWPGSRVPWCDVEGFHLTGSEAVRLKIKRRPWTQWFGPTIPTGGRGTHDLVVALEARRIYNLAGRG